MDTLNLFLGLLLILSSILMLAFAVEHEAKSKVELYAQKATVVVGFLDLIAGLVAAALVAHRVIFS